MTVNALRKASTDEEVISASKQLIKSWKKFVPGQKSMPFQRFILYIAHKSALNFFLIRKNFFANYQIAMLQNIN